MKANIRETRVAALPIFKTVDVQDYLARFAFSISLAACGSTFRPLDACRERWMKNASTSRPIAVISSRASRSFLDCHAP